MIGPFCLKYYNKNYYKDVALEDFPALIEKLKNIYIDSVITLENNQEAFTSYDHYMEAKAYNIQSKEKLTIAKEDYLGRIDNTLINLKRILNMYPESALTLQVSIESFEQMRAQVL